MRLMERILFLALTCALIAVLALIAAMLISMRGMQPARPVGASLSRRRKIMIANRQPPIRFAGGKP